MAISSLSNVLKSRRPRIAAASREQIRRDLLTWDFGNPEADPGYAFVDKLVGKQKDWDRDYAAKVVEEFRRFVLLWVYFPEATLVPSSSVDEAWHLAILFTRRYAHMCNRFFGGFKHHNPSTSDAKKVDLQSAYLKTLERYLEVFGTKPPADIWTVPTPVLSCENGCGIISCHGGCGHQCEILACHSSECD